jgi:hypothetical protein
VKSSMDLGIFILLRSRHVVCTDTPIPGEVIAESLTHGNTRSTTAGACRENKRDGLCVIVRYVRNMRGLNA